MGGGDGCGEVGAEAVVERWAFGTRGCEVLLLCRRRTIRAGVGLLSFGLCLVFGFVIHDGRGESSFTPYFPI